MVRAIEAPGTEVILENLFTIKGDECIGVEVSVIGVTWRDVVVHLLENQFGTAIAYRHRITGEVRMNPEPSEEVDALVIFLLVKQRRHVTAEQIQRALGELEAKVPEPA